MHGRYRSVGIPVVLLLLGVNCLGADVEPKTPKPATTAAPAGDPGNSGNREQINVVALGSLVFDALTKNDAGIILNALRTPPYSMSFADRGRQKSITIGVSEYEQMQSTLQHGFIAVRDSFLAEGLALNDLRLDKIIAEYDNDNQFRIVEIYLVINTSKGRYRVRIEDCLRTGDKYFIENLKWLGQKEYSR